MNAKHALRSDRGGTAPPFARIVPGDAREPTSTDDQAVGLRPALGFAR